MGGWSRKPSSSARTLEVDGERPACRRVGGVLIGDDRVQPVVAPLEGDEHQGARRAGGATRRGGGREEGVEGLGSEGGPGSPRAAPRRGEELAAVEAPAGLRWRCRGLRVGAGAWRDPSQLVTNSGETRASVSSVSGSPPPAQGRRVGWTTVERQRAPLRRRGAPLWVRRPRGRCPPQRPDGCEAPAGQRPELRASTRSAQPPPTLAGRRALTEVSKRGLEPAAPVSRRSRSLRGRQGAHTYSVGCFTSPVRLAADVNSGWLKMASSSAVTFAVGAVATDQCGDHHVVGCTGSEVAPERQGT